MPKKEAIKCCVEKHKTHLLLGLLGGLLLLGRGSLASSALALAGGTLNTKRNDQKTFSQTDRPVTKF